MNHGAFGDFRALLPTRRRFLQSAGSGFGSLALASLLHQESVGQTPSRQPHFAPKVRSVIWLFMTGGPSQVDLFDYKPQLEKFDGTLPPKELLEGYRAAFINPSSKLTRTRLAVLSTSSLRIASRLCFSTVLTLVRILLAISFVEYPSTIRSTTCRSRGERRSSKFCGFSTYTSLVNTWDECETSFCNTNT